MVLPDMTPVLTLMAYNWTMIPSRLKIIIWALMPEIKALID